MREGWCNVAFSPTFQAAQAVSGGSLRVGSEKRIRGSSGVEKKKRERKLANTQDEPNLHMASVRRL